MENKSQSATIKPVLTLFILSPVIAELLTGSTPVSRCSQLIMEAFFYGSGVLILRELVRRNNLGWLSVILLGVAFGVIEECLTLQSAFNPDFLGFDLSFGRFLGVNWLWAEIIIGYHAIWSITIPVLFAELLFPDKSTQPWLSKTGIWITGIIYILSCIGFHLIFYKMSGFSTSWIHYLGAGTLALVLIILSLYIPKEPIFKYQYKAPSYFVTGLIAFLGSALWLAILSAVFTKGLAIPAWLLQLSGVGIILILLFLVLGCTQQSVNNYHRFSVACGGLLASMLFGLMVLVESKNMLDIVSQIILILLTTVLLFLFHKKIVIETPLSEESS